MTADTPPGERTSTLLTGGAGPAGDAASAVGRLRVVFRLRVADGQRHRFLEAYRRIRHRVARVDGYLGDQLCQSEDDPDEWVLTSEWSSPAHFHRWEASAGHRELAGPLMACVTSRESRRYRVRLATAPLPPARGPVGGGPVRRYALAFTVRPESVAEVAEILAGYSSPPAGRAGDGPRLLDRTSVFMAGPLVVRVVDITGPPSEVVRHLAGQPQVRAVEERLRPHLTLDRDLSDDDGRRRFLATAGMRVVASVHGCPGHPPRTAAVYRALPGRGGEVARRLAADAAVPGRNTTVFRRRDLVVHLVESPDATLEVPLAGELAPIVRTARPMTLVTDRIAGVSS
ncbi:SchA/CurD-like domain-containing protein [Actinosynnema sp. NPDC059335]|uniref:SchA/CurD-like domain-containing protein n=1 Tax=Actinosynnema sp. NPDC059335 TaxID=3346804 RepID=UPI003671A3A0